MTRTDLTVMPWPARLERGGSRFRLEEGLPVAVVDAAEAGAGRSRTLAAAARAVSRMEERTGLSFRGPVPMARRELEDDDGKGLVVRARTVAPLTPEADESYDLRVSGRGVRLTAPTDLGAIRGLQTVIQLLEVDGSGAWLPGVRVRDHPRFSWRGLMLDVARHFLPVPVIRRNLDAMERLKMNVLHLHLSDDQAFRVESRRFPRLHERASDGSYYSQDEIREIVSCADERGIRVVPEFDVPGHATSWLVAHPELASGRPPRALEKGFGIFSAVLDPSRDDTYRFLGEFLEEMAEIFPDGYVHLGGDEVRGGAWRGDSRIGAYMEDRGIGGPAGLQAHFLERMVGRLRELDRTPVVWEGLADELPPETVVQAWKGRRALEQAVQRGQPALLSRGYYLDLMRPAERHYWVDPLPIRRRLSPGERDRVLGGEAAMWSEHVDARTVDSRVWPRAAAVAERLWSPARITDTGDMYRRLVVVSGRLENLGIRHRSGPREILREIAGEEAGDALDALDLLRGLSAPVEGLRWRHSDRDYTVDTSLDRFVDAAVPDPPGARRFRKRVDEYVKSEDGDGPAALLRQEFRSWGDAARVVSELARRRPRAEELEPLARSLEALAGRGLEALERRERGRTASSGWHRRAMEDVRAARRAVADVRLRVVHAVSRLMDGAAGGRGGG